MVAGEAISRSRNSAEKHPMHTASSTCQARPPSLAGERPSEQAQSGRHTRGLRRHDPPPPPPPRHKRAAAAPPPSPPRPPHHHHKPALHSIRRPAVRSSASVRPPRTTRDAFGRRGRNSQSAVRRTSSRNPPAERGESAREGRGWAPVQADDVAGRRPKRWSARCAFGGCRLARWVLACAQHALSGCASRADGVRAAVRGGEVRRAAHQRVVRLAVRGAQRVFAFGLRLQQLRGHVHGGARARARARRVSRRQRSCGRHHLCVH